MMLLNGCRVVGGRGSGREGRHGRERESRIVPGVVRRGLVVLIVESGTGGHGGRPPRGKVVR